jgi:salicylate hydroxylase
MFQEKILSKYGAPFWDLHRADLQRALARRAQQLGAVLRLGAKVIHIDFEEPPAVRLDTGEVIAGDLVIGADGLWSLSRDLFLGQSIPAKQTGDLAYRIVLTHDEIADPELRDWVANPAVHFWIGPHAHAVAYSLRAGEMFNIVLLCPDDLPENVRKAEGSSAEMMALFESWDPV